MREPLFQLTHPTLRLAKGTRLKPMDLGLQPTGYSTQGTRLKPMDLSLQPTGYSTQGTRLKPMDLSLQPTGYSTQTDESQSATYSRVLDWTASISVIIINMLHLHAEIYLKSSEHVILCKESSTIFWPSADLCCWMLHQAVFVAISFRRHRCCRLVASGVTMRGERRGAAAPGEHRRHAGLERGDQRLGLAQATDDVVDGGGAAWRPVRPERRDGRRRAVGVGGRRWVDGRSAEIDQLTHQDARVVVGGGQTRPERAEHVTLGGAT